MRPSRPSRRCGFTLIETMAAVVVLTTLGSIASFMVVDAVGDYQEAATAAQLHAELAMALDRAGRELREVPLSLSSAGTWTSFTFFFADLQILWNDENSLACGIFISAGQLRLQLAAVTNTLMNNVTSIGLKAYGQDDEDLGPLLGATAGLIRRVELTVNATRDGVSQSLRTNVFVRSCAEGNG